MARVAEGRAPAAPNSPGQRDRYRRILRAASQHGAQHGFDRVQMHEIAKDAEVAIGTLYRYFPSKVALFTSLLHHQVDRLDDVTLALRPGQGAPEAVANVLVRAAEQLLRQPLLAQAMLHANNTTVATETSTPPVTSAFAALMMRVAGVDSPTAHDHRLVRLIEQTWYGVLVSQLNGLIDAEEAELDTRLGCRLLLGDLGVRPATRGP